MRIAIIAFEYRVENLRLLPWHYVSRLSQHLLDLGQEVTIITDGYPQLPARDIINGVSVVHLHQVKHFSSSNSEEMVKAMQDVNPDVTLWLVGLTAFFQTALFKKIRTPIVALVASPVYWRKEMVRNLSLGEVFQERDFLMTSIIQNLCPRFLVRDTFNSEAINMVVVMSHENEKRFKSLGVKASKIVHVPPGIDPDYLKSPSLEQIQRARAEVCRGESEFLVTYFGPPLRTRGVDTLLQSLKFALTSFPSLRRIMRVLILSRTRKLEYQAQERKILKLIKRCGCDEVVTYKSGFQDAQELKAYISASDLLVFPFKHVVTDSPLGVLEALSLGKPVLSTSVDGLGELLEHSKGLLIRPRDFKTLGNIIGYFSNNMGALRKYGQRGIGLAASRPTWRSSAKTMLDLFESIVKSESGSRIRPRRG